MSKPEETLTRKDVIDIVVERMKAVSARTSMSQAPNQVFQMQADATYAGTPSSGVAVDVLTTTKNVRIITAACIPVFSGGASHTAEIHITVDGQTITFLNSTPSTGDIQEAAISRGMAADQVLYVEANERYRAFLLEGRSVAVTFELTTDGTPGASSARVKYAKIP